MPGLPCAVVETAYVALSPVSRFSVATVVLQLSSDAQVRSDLRTAARLDARNSGVTTTRFCRTRSTSSYTRPLIAHGDYPPCDRSWRQRRPRPPPLTPRTL